MQGAERRKLLDLIQSSAEAAAPPPVDVPSAEQDEDSDISLALSEGNEPVNKTPSHKPSSPKLSKAGAFKASTPLTDLTQVAKGLEAAHMEAAGA